MSFNKVLRAAGAAILAFAAFSLVPASAQDKVLVVAVSADPGQFNPSITTAANVHSVADSLFNGLVGLDEALQPTPDLATSWTVSDDGLTYTFTLANATWHDGMPVTSEDVKFTFQEVLFKHHSRTKAGLANVVTSIDTPDPQTAVFNLSAPHPALLRRLNVTEAAILPRHLYEGADPTSAPANTNPVGSGPFVFVSHAPGDRIVLDANPNYFKADGPGVDRVVFRIITDSNAAGIAFAQGEVDYLPRLKERDIAAVQATDKGDMLFSTSGPGGGNCIMTVTFNLDREITSNPAVRKALATAIDRDRLLDQVLFGRGTVAKAPFSSAIAWAHDASAFSGNAYDPEAAQTLLQDAGFGRDGDGVRLELDMVHFPNYTKYSELMAQDLAKIGIKLTSRPLDREAAVDAIFKKRDFDTNLISYCNGVDPEIGIKRMYVSNNIGPIPFSNGAAYRSDKIDALFATAGSTADETARAAAYSDIQNVLAEDLPYWWLVETTRISAYNTAFTGFKPWTGHYLETVRPVN